MTPLMVLDASVLVKWLLADPERERDVEHAQSLLAMVTDGQVTVCQPVHWLVEVAAVLARLTPKTADEDVAMLQGLELATDNAPATLSRACQMSRQFDHHLFDTLYHAVAIEHDAVLVTADQSYLRKVRAAGHICHLAQWRTAHQS